MKTNKVLHGHILCWNEKELVPFVMDYWKNIGVDKLFVYDNGSTDGTLEELEKYDFVQVIPFTDDKNEGYTNEFVLTRMRNTAWKVSKYQGVADWVIVSDFDEVPYFSYGKTEGGSKNWFIHGLGNNNSAQFNDTPSFAFNGTPTFKDYLAWLDEMNVSIVRTHMHQLLKQGEFPEYHEGLLHTYEGMHFYDADTNMDKTLLFNCRRVQDTNYSLGSHNAQFIARGYFSEYPDSELCFFHLKHIGRDYILKKTQRLYDNLEPNIKAQGIIDCHYLQYLQNYDNMFEGYWNNSYPANIK